MYQEKKDWLYKLDKLDRRIIFALVAIVLIVTILMHVNLKFVPSNVVKKEYDLINSLPPKTPVLISFDYGVSTTPEVQPMAKAVVRHCFEKDLRVIAIALWPDGVKLADNVLDTLAKEYEKVKGVDYINLGYMAGGVAVIEQMGTSITKVFPTANVNGEILQSSNLDVMKGVKSYKDLGAVVSLSAGDPGIKQYIMIANGRYGVKVTGGVTAVTAPEVYPYLDSGQLTGLMGGLRGAADYEQLIHHPGRASELMFPQSIAHFLIIFLIIIGNIIYFIKKWRDTNA